MISIQKTEGNEALKLERLRQEIKVRLDQIERGEVFDGKEVFAQLEEELNN